MKHLPRILTALGVLWMVFFTSHSAFAQKVTWTGGSTGEWNVSTNWSGNSLPVSSGTAYINSGTADLTNSVTGTTGVFIMGSTATVGALTVTGGNLTFTSGTIGQASSSNDTVSVTGGSLTAATSLVVGVSGTSTLTINGGSASTGSLNIAAKSTVNVTSGTLTATSDTDIGTPGGTATLNINGGYFSNVNTNIGYQFAVTSVTVSSGTWISSGTLTVGTTGTGNLTVNGGYLSTAAATIGSSSSAPGNATVSSGTWVNSGSFIVAAGVLKINGTGVLDVGNGTGTVTLNSGGQLDLSPGGTLEAGQVVNSSGTGTIMIETTGSSNIGASISGSVSVQRTSGGTTVLTGSNTYTGSTTVSGGQLSVQGSITKSTATVSTGTLNGSGTTANVIVNSGGVLAGTLHSGTVTINQGGAISPGDAPGTYTATSVTIGGTGSYICQIAAPTNGSWAGAHPVAGTDYDQILLTGTANGVAETVGTLSNGSILEVNITGGALPLSGEGSPVNPYIATGSNSSLDNYFIMKPSDSVDTVSGKFTKATADGLNFVTIDYSSGNLVGGANGDGTFTLGGQEWVISYTGEDATNSTVGGNDVVLTALTDVPEPSSVALIALGAVAISFRLVKRRKIADF